MRENELVKKYFLSLSEVDGGQYNNESNHIQEGQSFFYSRLSQCFLLRVLLLPELFVIMPALKSIGDDYMENAIALNPASVLAQRINEDEAMTEANGFILEHLADRFCAGLPHLLSFPARLIWATPILLSYPEIGPVGEVGFIAVDAELGNVVGWTPFPEIYKAAEKIYSDKRAHIEAAFY